MGPGCVLKSFADPALRGPLLGLTLSPYDTLQLDRAYFPCCEGEGVRVVGAWEMEQCGLRGRLGRVGTIWMQMVQLYGRRTALEALGRLSLDQEVRMLTRLRGLATGEAARGLAIPKASPRGAPSRGDKPAGPGQEDSQGAGVPSVLWLTALAASWRFGIACHVVCWNAGGKDRWLPPGSFWQGDGPKMLIVTDVSQLWDAARGFDFDWLVGYAYQAQLPMWVEFLRGDSDPLPASRESRPSRRGKAFASMLSATRERGPLEWLTDDTRGKLEDVCDISPLLGQGRPQ